MEYTFPKKVASEDNATVHMLSVTGPKAPRTEIKSTVFHNGVHNFCM